MAGSGLALKWDLIAGLLAVSGTHLSSSSPSSRPFWAFPVWTMDDSSSGSSSSFSHQARLRGVISHACGFDSVPALLWNVLSFTIKHSIEREKRETLHRQVRAHRPSRCGQASIKTLFPRDLRLWQVDS